MTKTVIIGGSHAAIALAARLRQLDADADITVVSAENEYPYQRPPLSKAYMSGKSSFEQILLRPENWYADNHIGLLRGEAIGAIDRGNKTVSMRDGRTLSYDHLVLTTGARARRLPQEVGGQLPNVYVMRDIGDANHLMAEMKQGRRLVVIGGGYIGLEAASEARKKGVEVTVLEAADRILKRVAAEETASDIRALHRSHGVTIRENVKLDRIVDDQGHATGVQLESGEILPADFIITGIGVAPNTTLASDCGLAVDNGIVVDAGLRTEDPAIFAAGDCATFPYQGRCIRLESVQNANDQGALIAANITGQSLQYAPVPWFWSDQYDMKLQIAGLNSGYDDVITRAGPREGAHSHFYFQGGTLLAADCLNDAATYMLTRKILETGKTLTKAQVADPAFVLKSVLG
jgi:3-phenylpropionate/trans-cinnamate dioxygenase ferredoxin reductase subunit